MRKVTFCSVLYNATVIRRARRFATQRMVTVTASAGKVLSKLNPQEVLEFRPKEGEEAFGQPQLWRHGSGL